MMNTKTIEDYLKAILKIQKRRGYVRNVDIADELNVSKPTITHAVRKLNAEGYIMSDPVQGVALTDKGAAIAESTFERHKTFTIILTALGVDKATAERDACKLEHDVSSESYTAFLKLRQLFAKEDD